VFFDRTYIPTQLNLRVPHPLRGFCAKGGLLRSDDGVFPFFLLLTVICYLLSVRFLITDHLLANPHKTKPAEAFAPAGCFRSKFSQAVFLTSAACGPLGPCTISNSTASPSCNVR